KGTKHSEPVSGTIAGKLMPGVLPMAVKLCSVG
ncbi:unnamed protein product, partial [marine sediment metagenome]